MPTHRVLRSAAAKAARSRSRGLRILSIPLCAAFAVLSGCGAHAAPDVRGPDELVLLVGGDQPSLRAALVARGLQPAPPRALAPVATPPAGTQPRGAQPLGRQPVAGGGGGAPAEATDPPADDDPAPQQGDVPPQPRVPAQDDEWVVVPLPKGETLIHVARRHLGDGRRFIDLMKWNGWSEEDTWHLSENTPVRIRRSEMP